MMIKVTNYVGLLNLPIVAVCVFCLRVPFVEVTTG